MKLLKSLLLAAVPAALLYSFSAVAAPDPRADLAPPPTPAPEEWTAKSAWDDTCAKCHGTDGKGMTKIGDKVREKGKVMPDLTTTTTDPGKFGDIIAKGVPDSMMKAYENKFTADQLKALGDFAKAFKH